MSGIYNHYTGNDQWVWSYAGRTDHGFFNYQRLLRSGAKTDIGNAVTGWQSVAMDLRTVVNQLTAAYQAISGTWSGEAANDFYAEMAKVQNYAMSLLLQVDSAMAGQGSTSQLISALTAAAGSGAAGGTGGGYVTPDPAASGYAAMVGLTGGASTPDQVAAGGGAGGGDGTISGDMVSILHDAEQMLGQATTLANATLPDPNSYGLVDIAQTAWKLTTWMIGQAAHEQWQDQLAFYGEVAGFVVTAILAPEVVAASEVILAIADTLNTPFSEPVRDLVLGTMTSKVMLDTLGWHSLKADGSASPPVANMNAMGWGWVSMQKGLPGKLDPSRITNGTAGTGPSGPGYPGPGSPSLPGGPGKPTTPPLHTPPVSTPKLSTPTNTGGPKMPTTGTTDPFKSTDNGFKPYDPHGASLASYNPHSGLGGGSGFGGGSGLGGLNPNDGHLASYDPRAGLGAGDGTAGAGLGSGAGAGGNGSVGGAAGAAGRAMPMSPGSGAGGNKDDKGRNRTAYLSEDEDVWGAGGDIADGVL